MAARPDWLVDTDESENGEFGAVENESAYREVCRDGLFDLFFVCYHHIKI
jgi:hypothetical protein